MRQVGDRIIFGFRVRQLRLAAGLSYAELARKSGLSVSFLNEIEKGKKSPRPEKLADLARGLGYSVQKLTHIHTSPDPGALDALLKSNFLSELPLDLFGIDTAGLMRLLSHAPAKVNAFIVTLVELAQQHSLGTGHFYLSAMRAYQEQHRNYFPEIEEAARACRDTLLHGKERLDESILHRALLTEYGVRVVKSGLAPYPVLHHLRAVYIPRKKELWLHPGLTDHQITFQMAKELGFHYLKLQPRTTSAVPRYDLSFSQVLNNFKAGYFAVALQIDSQQFLETLSNALLTGTFRHQNMLSWMERFRVGPDVLFQRFNVITGRWGLDHVFYHRVSLNNLEKKLFIDKELHISGANRRYAGRPGEHYCRRWLSSELVESLADRDDPGPVTGQSVVQFDPSDEVWLCLGLAQRSPLSTHVYTGIMIGVMLDDASRERFAPIIDDRPPIHIGLTCERCPLSDCEKRQSPPVILQRTQQQKIIRDTLRKITE